MYYNTVMDSEKRTSNSCKRTQNTITSAFIDLLQNTSFYDISVQDILCAANISRTTFYRYWEDKYLLLRNVKEKYLTYVYNLVDALSSDNIRLLSSSMQELNRQRKIYYALENAQGEVDLREEILSICKKMLADKKVSQNVLMVLATLIYTCITYISSIDITPHKPCEQTDDKTLNIFIKSFSSFSSL